MKNSLKNALTSKHSGYGGLYFVTTNIICAFILTISLQMSWMSQAVAMADNLSYIVAINTTVHNYISNVPSYTNVVNPSVPIRTGGNYLPLNDFNKMLQQTGLSTSGTSSCTVSWNGRATTVQMESFRTILGTYVKPHKQNAVIENY